jgi:hypothetical protein
MPGDEYQHGGKAEFFTDFKKAAERFLHHKQQGTLYRGVHYKGKHVMTVKAAVFDPVNCNVVTK